MFVFAQLLTQICLFRRGPEDLPTSNLLLGLLVALNILLSITLYLYLTDLTLLRASTLVVASLAGAAGLIWLVLSLMNFSQRFVQTFTAMVGVDVILGLLNGLLTVFTLQENGTYNTFGSFAWLALTIWNLSIYATIFQRALEVHAAIGLGIALFVVLFSYAIGQVALTG